MASLFSTPPLAHHMGQLHAYENFLVVAIAFGPFLVLGMVVFLIRRRDLAEDDQADAESTGSGQAGSESAATESAATDSRVSPDRPPAT